MHRADSPPKKPEPLLYKGEPKLPADQGRAAARKERGQFISAIGGKAPPPMGLRPSGGADKVFPIVPIEEILGIPGPRTQQPVQAAAQSARMYPPKAFSPPQPQIKKTAKGNPRVFKGGKKKPYCMISATWAGTRAKETATGDHNHFQRKFIRPLV